MLRQFGYASLQFPSAEAFANQSDFDEAACVLLDINLGDGSGIEVRQRLKAAGNTVPVIYMTANDTPAVREVQHYPGQTRHPAARPRLPFLTPSGHPLIKVNDT
jgi:FixJ family two-component response regulator